MTPINHPRLERLTTPPKLARVVLHRRYGASNVYVTILEAPGNRRYVRITDAYGTAWYFDTASAHPPTPT
jgi:hypothetical protein